MKNYIDAAIARSRTTISVFIVTLLAGLASYFSIPIEMYPDVQVPMVVTTIIHEGISPEDSERLLSQTRRIGVENDRRNSRSNLVLE